MEPYWTTADGLTLYLGDMLEAHPLTPADLLLTDPPYARAGAVHSGRTGNNGRAQDVIGADQFWSHWFKDVVKAMVGRCKPEACGFIFCDYQTVPLVERAFHISGDGWEMTQCLVWDRDSVGLGSPFRASHELIAFVRGPSFVHAGSRSLRNVLRFRWPYGMHEWHPAEKPVSLLIHLIENFCPPDGLVYDPFAGSASTLIAARETGRRAVGIEIAECHAATAVQRLCHAVLPFAELLEVRP